MKNGDKGNILPRTSTSTPPTSAICARHVSFVPSRAYPKEDGAYHYTLEQVFEEAAHANEGLTREFHIVGGLDMQAGLGPTAPKMFRGLKRAASAGPHQGQALTPLWRLHISPGSTRCPHQRTYSSHCGEAGLDTLPGGGAEVFGRGVRMAIADKKLAAEDWISVHRTAHQLEVSACQLYHAVRARRDNAGSRGSPDDAARPTR